MTTVLLVEDDDDTAMELGAELIQRGYHATRAADGGEGLQRARAERPQAMIVDHMLPQMDGLDLIARLRREGGWMPVLILSALGGIEDRVRGLRAGGDDYLVKPFALIEMIARLEALLRRPPETRETVLRVGDLELDLIEHRARRGARPIELLPREYRLLEFLMRRESELVTRSMLFQEVWNYRFVPATNLVDVHIGRLRRKIDAADEPSMIQSVRGAGFMLQAPG